MGETPATVWQRSSKSNGNLCICSLNTVFQHVSWFTAFWKYLMAICVILQREGGPGSWKTSNGSIRLQPPLLLLLHLCAPCWWLFRERRGELIDHNKMNEMGQLRSPTQTSLWKCISFRSHFTSGRGSFKSNKWEAQVWMSPVKMSEGAARSGRWW